MDDINQINFHLNKYCPVPSTIPSVNVDNIEYHSFEKSYYSLWPFEKNVNYCTERPSWNYPVSDFNRWSTYYTPLWPIIIIGIIVYLVWTEYGSQDCRQQDCNNRAKFIEESDTNLEAIDKISYNVLKNHTVIGWRRTLIVAIFLTIIILFIMCPGFPDGFTVFVTTVIIFFLVYFSSAWFQAHWWKFNDYRIDSSLQELRHRLHS